MYSESYTRGTSISGAVVPSCVQFGSLRLLRKGAVTVRKARGVEDEEKTTEKNSNVLPGNSMNPPQLHHMTFQKENATLLLYYQQAPISFNGRGYLTNNYLNTRQVYTPDLNAVVQNQSFCRLRIYKIYEPTRVVI